MASYSFGARWIRPLLLIQCIVSLFSGIAFAETVDVKKKDSNFSLEFRDAEIRDVLRAVGQAAGLNMVVGDTVAGKVSLSVKDVELLEALDAILKTKGLSYVRNGNIMRVLMISEVRDEDMETRVFPLGYATGKDALTVVEKVKSDKAKVSVDLRMNAIMVKDLSLNLDKMAHLIRNIDARTPQVLIEAKIVEVSSNYARELGIQWGGQYTGTNGRIFGGTTAIANTSGGTSAPLVGGNTFYPLSGDIGVSGNAYVVNLPAEVGLGSGGALGMTFAKLGSRLTLDLQLSAMQATGNGKILSNPKVLTVNNKEAKISSGTDIPVRTISATANVGAGSTNTAGVTTISASLSLSTTPIITNDNRIALLVKVEKSEPDFTHQVDGIPTIVRRSANSELIVNNGETVALGGIYTKNEGTAETGIPLLSKIPLIGWLFKKTTRFENQSELMIFITPTILEEKLPGTAENGGEKPF